VCVCVCVCVYIYIYIYKPLFKNSSDKASVRRRPERKEMAAMKVRNYVANSNITVSNTERKPKPKYVSITLHTLEWHPVNFPQTVKSEIRSQN